MNIEKNNIIKYIKTSMRIVESFNKMTFEKDNVEEIIDIYGQVIEVLNLFSKYITELIGKGILANDFEINVIRNETIMFKEYCINYVDGLLNPNEYIISKYRNLINDQHSLWVSVINQYFCLQEEN